MNWIYPTEKKYIDQSMIFHGDMLVSPSIDAIDNGLSEMKVENCRCSNLN